MRNARTLLVGLACCLLAVSSPPGCQAHAPVRPDGPVCVNGKDACFCHDETLPEGSKDYSVPRDSKGCLDNISTTPEHYRELEEWIEDLIRIIEEKENCR